MDKKFNPWTMMWTRPRLAIRKVIEVNPKKGFYYLASISVLQNYFLLSGYYYVGLTKQFLISLGIVTVLSPLIGAIWFYFYGWLLYVVGKWLGGQAPPAYVRAAFAWSKLPLLLNVILWFLLLIFASNYLFIYYSRGYALFFIRFVSLAASIWSLILLIETIREVQGFSLGRTLANVVLSYFFFLVLVFFISLVYSLLYNLGSFYGR